MNRALIIGILGGVIVLAAVVLTFFIDRPPDGAEKAATAPPVQSATPKAAEVTAKAPTPATETKPEPTVSDSPKQPEKPSFDVVRINPRGDTVLAGRAEPHAEVTIKDGDKVIGKVTADARGEWVQVPEKALPPGTRELSLTAKSAEQKEPVNSENKVVLVVPERGLDIAGRETPGDSGALVIAVPRDGSAGVKVLQTPGIRADATTRETETSDPKAAAADGRKMAQAETDRPAATGSTTPKSPGEIVVATAKAEKSARDATSSSEKPAPATTRGLATESNGADAGQGEGISVSGLTLDAIDYDDTGRLALTGKAKAGANVHVYLDNRPLGAASADQTGRWQLEPGETIPPGLYRMRVDQVDSKGKVLARIETPFSRSEPLGDLPRDSVVFVQPGNSLWRIARRTYGEGVRYSVIYEANRAQIRNPDLIYPGQVFHLPRVN